MSYWHMQLHQDDEKDTQEHIYKILETGYIGLGDWENGHNQIKQFKFTMKKDDIVLVRHKGAVALVQIIGKYQEELNPNSSLDWFIHRRKIKILAKYDSNKFPTLPKKLGSAYYATTLQSCNTFTGDINNEKYSIGDYIHEWHKLVIKEQKKMEFKQIINLLKNRNQIILQGPPGTGKTRLAKQMAISMIKSSYPIDTNEKIKNSLEKIGNDRVKLIQFHPSYSYEDFVRGIVADSSSGTIIYKTKDKILAQMAKTAQDDKDKKPYILIIDEINRANLSSVLGELIYALEYRDEAVESMYEIAGSRKITLPSNLYIIGTMNTADRSVGHIDYAIRRRFAFESILPDESAIDLEEGKKLFKKVEKIFDDYISIEFDKNDVKLGHSYFIANDKNELEEKLKYQIKPLLREYLKDGVLRDEAKLEIDELSL